MNIFQRFLFLITWPGAFVIVLLFTFLVGPLYWVVTGNRFDDILIKMGNYLFGD